MPHMPYICSRIPGSEIDASEYDINHSIETRDMPGNMMRYKGINRNLIIDFSNVVRGLEYNTTSGGKLCSQSLGFNKKVTSANKLNGMQMASP